MILGERIKKVRKEMDLTQQEFCDRIGLKRNSISLVESGKRNISDQAIKSICREFAVNEEWLRTGKGEMFKAAPSGALDALAAERGLTHGDYIFIEKFLCLKPESRQTIISYMREVAAALDYDDTPAETPAYSDDLDIDAAVAEYRRQLLDEKERTVKSSVSKSANSSKEKLA